MKPVPLFAPAATVLSLGLMLCGCNTAGGGGGGGGGDGDGGGADDPLPEYQLGEDPELDADVAAITQADNEAEECYGGTTVHTDEDELLALKHGYAANPESADTFEDFVHAVAGIEASKRDQICDTNLGDDEDLDASVQRVTDAANQAAECQGQDQTATPEDSLLAIKILFFDAGIRAGDLVEFAEDMAAEAEQEADEACREAEGG